MTLAIGGFVPFSTVDYPGALAAVVFCQGCPWRCPYCQNPHLQNLEPGRAWEQTRDDLRRRRGLLEAVVFSGGEPLLQPGLARAITEVRMMGFHAGLHTGGSHPGHLEMLLPHLNWVGLDIKAPPDQYEAITGCPESGEHAWRSLALLQSSRTWCEVRTTWHPALLPDEAMLELASRLAEGGVREWVIQAFRQEGCRRELPPCELSPSLLRAVHERFRGQIHLRSQDTSELSAAYRKSPSRISPDSLDPASLDPRTPARRHGDLVHR